MNGEATPGTFVRVAGGYGYVTPFAYRGTVGRVVGVESGTGRVQVRFPRGAVNVDGEFPHVVSVGHDGTDGTFHADWLHRVVYVRVRFYGPGMMPGRSEFSGSRYVATGARGNRSQLTHAADHALTPDGNREAVAIRFARERVGMVAPIVESWQERTGAYVYAITDTGTCDCTDDAGPCEAHADMATMREGSSARAADDLAHTFLTDVPAIIGRYPSDDYREAVTRLGNALADSGGSWFEDPDDAEEVRDLVTTGEHALSDAGYWTYWDDGYRIVRPLPGCPLLSR